MNQILRLIMALGGWRVLGRLMNRWADRGTPDGPAGKQMRRQRRRSAGAGMRGVRMLMNMSRWMR